MNNNPLPRVLVIDDEVQIRRLLRVTLESGGFIVHDAENGRLGLSEAAAIQPEAIILDLGLPDLDGLEVLRRLREWTRTPVLVLTARDREQQKIEALDAGADDYMCKPFSFNELMARMRAAFRRSGFATDTAPRKISAQGLEVDFANRKVVAGGKVVRMTPTEFDILRYMAGQPNKPIPHKRLLQAIWGPEYGDQIEYLRVFINQLRKKIEPGVGKPVFITTEPRVGYRFVLPEVAIPLSAEPETVADKDGLMEGVRI